VLAAAVAVVAAAKNRRALGWAAVVLAAAVLVHVTLVLPPADSLQLLRRSAEMLAVVDAAHYTPLGSVEAFVTQLPQVFALAVVVGALGLVPVLAPRGRRRETSFAALTGVAVLSACGALLLDDVWSGGYRRAHVGASGILGCSW
jgi:hypothetical protein